MGEFCPGANSARRKYEFATYRLPDASKIIARGSSRLWVILRKTEFFPARKTVTFPFPRTGTLATYRFPAASKAIDDGSRFPIVRSGEPPFGAYTVTAA